MVTHEFKRMKSFRRFSFMALIVMIVGICITAPMVVDSFANFVRS